MPKIVLSEDEIERLDQYIDFLYKHDDDDVKEYVSHKVALYKLIDHVCSEKKRQQKLEKCLAKLEERLGI